MVKIVSKSGVVGGKPVIAGTRISVEVIMNLLAGGMTIEGVLKEYPTLQEADVRTAMRYVASKVSGERVETSCNFNL